jgi:hypothetical protein
MWPARDDPTRAARLYGPKDGSEKKEQWLILRKKSATQQPSRRYRSMRWTLGFFGEKAARLKELRLAREATNAQAGSPAVVSGQKKLKRTRKSADTSQSLSDWLTTQQNEGRRG